MLKNSRSKFIILFICVLISFPGYSRWEKIHENVYSSEYFRVDTAKKIDGFIYIWSMADYNEPKKDGFLSTKYFSKFDCSKSRYKVLSIIEYKTQMGKGRDFQYTKNISDEKESTDWVYPDKDSSDYIKIDFVCNF